MKPLIPGFMDRDAEGIEFAIVVPATQKRLLLLLLLRHERSECGEFATHIPHASSL